MKWLAILVCLASVVALGGPPKNKGALQKRLKTVRAKRHAVQEKLKQTKREVRATVSDIGALDQRMDTLESDLKETESKIATGVVRQRTLSEELAIAAAKLERTRADVRKRCRLLYMRGESSAVALLMGAADAGELASRAFLIRSVAGSDRALFDRYTRERREFEAKKRRQDELVDEMRGLKSRQKAKQGELASTKEEKQGALRSLQSQAKELERMLRQFEEDEADIAAEIAAFSKRTNSGKSLNLPKFHGTFIRPVDASITSEFGMRFHPILKIRRMHTGLDFGASVGTTVRASAGGVVILAEHKGGYGNTVVIEHGGGLQTLYGHLSRYTVSAGQRVSQGQTIGKVGNSGLSTGPHLHFEIRVNGRPVNPRSRL